MTVGNREIIIALVFGLIFMLMLTFGAFVTAQHMIGEYNKKAIECCYLLKCEVNPFGDIRCINSFRAEEEFNFSGFLPINLSGVSDVPAGFQEDGRP